MEKEAILPTALAFLAASLLVFLLFSQHSEVCGRTGPKADLSALSGVPLPKPLLNFEITKARPRPYRPFRWKYHQTMALMAMEPDWWIEIESTYMERVKQRQHLFEEHGCAILDAMPGSEAACKELMLMAIQFLCARYPTLFSYNSRTAIFSNHILGTIADARTVGPLMFLLNNIPEDFLVTQKDAKTGFYHLRAGVSCSAIGWNMAEKIGQPLHEIHAPVPHYKEKLKLSVDRFFENITCEKPVQRGSWSFQSGQPLYLQADHPEYFRYSRQDPDLKIEDMHLRVDWQTLRRLPQSRGIVFNFKALFTPVTHFRQEPYIPQLVARIMREAQTPIKDYKGWAHIEHKLLPALDLWAREQKEGGIVPNDWEERTLDEHPFYPGWMDELNQG